MEETDMSCEETPEIEDTMPCKRSRTKKRGRKRVTVRKDKRKENVTKKDEDSGFATCSEPVFLSDTGLSLGESQESNESVSLLQAAAGPERGMRVTFSGEDKVDKAVQTSEVCQSIEERDVKRNMNFVTSVVRLRQVIPKLKEPGKTCADMLREVITSGRLLRDGNDHDLDFREVSAETLRYIMKTQFEDVAETSVDSILLWLREEIQKGWRNLCDFWRDSLRADAVLLLNEAVDSGLGRVWKKVSDFLTHIFDEIDSEHLPEDEIEECRVSFLANACRSIFLVYDMIVHVTGRLRKRKLSFGSKSEEVAGVKWMYFSLRLLSELLRSFLNFLTEAGINEIVSERVEERTCTVLEMWREKWRNTPTPGEDQRKRYLNIINDWYGLTEELLAFCVKEAPLLTPTAQKCSCLSQELLLNFRSRL